MSNINPSEIAAGPSRLPLWDAGVKYPALEDIEDLSVVTHVAVERAQKGGYHYLHETAVAWHHGQLHMGWANHRTHEDNILDELIRGRVSADGGFTWSGAWTFVEPSAGGAQSYNHPVLFSDGGKLWGFFTAWYHGPAWETSRPATEIFQLDEATRQWKPAGNAIEGFIPFQPPMKLRDGNWIMGGEDFWYDAAVAISAGDDLGTWQMVRIPKEAGIDLRFPETALLEFGERLVAICRPRGVTSAPIAESRDGGRTWTALRLSNFPLSGSQPCAGALGTGQKFLITNHAEAGRAMLTIAVTRPGGELFERVWKIRHQQFPRRRLFPGAKFEGQEIFNSLGKPTEWSYPSAVEHEDRLYVSYTHGKEDGVLSIIPVSALAI